MPHTALAGTLVFPCEGKVRADANRRRDHPDEDVARSEEQSGREGGRDPRDDERAAGNCRSASQRSHEWWASELVMLAPTALVSIGFVSTTGGVATCCLRNHSPVTDRLGSLSR